MLIIVLVLHPCDIFVYVKKNFKLVCTCLILKTSLKRFYFAKRMSEIVKVNEGEQVFTFSFKIKVIYRLRMNCILLTMRPNVLLE